MENENKFEKTSPVLKGLIQCPIRDGETERQTVGSVALWVYAKTNPDKSQTLPNGKLIPYDKDEKPKPSFKGTIIIHGTPYQISLWDN